MNETSKSQFVLDVKAIRDRARSRMDDGAVTPGYPLDKETVIGMLNDALATEIVCVLRYRRHYFMVANVGGIPGFAVEDELLQHSQEELSHADRFAERIVQLGGDPDWNPATASTRSHVEYTPGKDLRAMLQEDLIAERIAIDTYRAAVAFLANGDPTTRRIFEDTLIQEEEHADELADFLRRLAFGTNGGR